MHPFPPHKTIDCARLWRPERMEGLSLFKARFRHFSYKRHTHEAFALGVIEQGAQAFYHQGRKHVAPAGSIITVNPGDVHDGKAFDPGGYQYRMVYLDPGMAAALLQRDARSGMPYGFRAPVTDDRELAARLHGALVMMDGHGGPESQAALVHALGDLFVRHAGPIPGCRTVKDRALADRACRFIHERLEDGVTLKEIADHAGMSQYHFLRMFKAVKGLPPHAYIIGLKVRRAKAAMEGGASIAEAAADCGFSDQSHLTRQFKAFYGLTPGQFRKNFISR